jgi:hypothetical protein
MRYLVFISLLFLLGCGSGVSGINFDTLSTMAQAQIMKCAGDPKCQEAVIKAAEAAYKQVRK